MSYFDTDWSAMTGNDWFYTIFSSVILFLMVIVYTYALNPKNKEQLEKQKHIPLDLDEEQHFGEHNVR